jgi:rhomboid protease GluP
MHYSEVMGSYPPTPPPHDLETVHGSSEPEFLPPGAGTFTSPPQARRQRSSWAAAPATYFLVGVNCAVYIAMVFKGVSAVSPTSVQLMHWGANNAGSVLIDGQWWRIVTAMFVHAGFLHLATNMWCLWNLGLLAEPLMGSAGVMAVYILTGAGGNLLSIGKGWFQFRQIWDAYHAAGGLDPSAAFPPGVGASGAVFGIAGALIVLLKSDRLPVPPIELKKLRRSVIYFAGLNLVLGLSINAGSRYMGAGLNIDNYAHMGGFGSGLLFAAPMIPRLGSPRPFFNLRLRVAVGMLVAVLVAVSFYLSIISG